MSGLTRLLVVADSADREPVALQRALALHEATGAHVHVVGFCHHDLYDQSGLLSATDRERLRTALTGRRVDEIRETLDRVELSAPSISFEVVWTRDAPDWLVAHQARHRYDLTISTRLPSVPVLHGSLERPLINHLPCSLLLCAQTAWIPGSSVLATLDLRVDDASHRHMNHAVLRAAAVFADIHGEIGPGVAGASGRSTLHAAYAVEPSDILRDLDIMPMESARQRSIEKARVALEPLVQAFGLRPENVHYPIGRIGPAIDRIAEATGADLVVVGTTARSRLANSLLGNSAERILEATQADVLIVRPDFPNPADL